MKRFIVFLTVIFLIGCGGEEKPEPESVDLSLSETPEVSVSDVFEPGEAIMPLKTGNTWNYQRSTFDTLSGEMVPTGIDSFKVVGDTVIGSETWYNVIGLGPNRGTVCNRNDGFWFVHPEQEPFLFAKYPAVPGEEYRYVLGEANVYNRVEETSLEVTVPAGTFTCFKYKQIMGQRRMTTDFYFSPGHGLIKTDIHGPRSDFMLFSAELTDKNF